MLRPVKMIASMQPVQPVQPVQPRPLLHQSVTTLPLSVPLTASNRGFCLSTLLRGDLCHANL